MLRHGEGWRGAAAAAATHALMGTDPTAGDRLRAALLDALKFGADLYDDEPPASQVAAVVAQIMRKIQQR